MLNVYPAAKYSYSLYADNIVTEVSEANVLTAGKSFCIKKTVRG